MMHSSDFVDPLTSHPEPSSGLYFVFSAKQHNVTMLTDKTKMVNMVNIPKAYLLNISTMLTVTMLKVCLCLTEQLAWL